MLEPTAYHEAGHAVTAVYVGARVEFLSIDPENDDRPARFGEASVVWPSRRFTERRYREKATLVSLAGPVAEMIHTDLPYHPGLVAEWADDWRTAWELSSVLVPSERRRLAYLEQTTADLLLLLKRDDFWAALAALADELLAHETLDGDEVHAVVDNWLS